MRRLVLVSAPAGYGKTTLVTEWLDTVDHPVAWLSLDEGDNDPAHFLAYLIAVFQQFDQGTGQAAAAMLHSPQLPPSEVVLTTLLNEIAHVSGPLLLILDDYHVIHTPVIHEQLTFLIEHLPPQMHLVVITREDPLLPLARLRARGQMLEIRQEDLRFNADETADFLGRVMGLDLSPDDIEALERRTEGWIAGLQLAALSMKGRADLSGFVQQFTGSSRFILDYLIEEVFEQQTAEMKDFLLQTSILDRLSGPLCDAVTERSASQAVLEGLEGANLFITALDHSRNWYRYHRLFAELLRSRMTSADVQTQLHRRASNWFHAEGLIAEAIQHTLAAEDWGRAAELIGQAAEDMLKRGRLLTLTAWYQRMPEAIIKTQPEFGLSYAWALLLQGRHDEADFLLNHYEGLARSASTAEVILGQVATAQAFIARAKGENPRVIEKSEEALSQLPESDHTSRSTLALNLGLVYWHEGRLMEAIPVLTDAQEESALVGNHYAELSAKIFIGRIHISQGALRRGVKLLLNVTQGGGRMPILALAHFDLSGVYYEWNDLESAWHQFNHGFEICKRSGNREFLNAGHILKAWLLLAEGDVPSALVEMETSLGLAREFNTATQARSMAGRAELALAIGDTAMAREWVEQMPVDVDANSFYRFAGLTRARLLLAEGKNAEAAGHLTKRFEQAVSAGWGYARIAVLVLQALTALRQEQALDYLGSALERAQPEGYIRTFVDAGEVIVPLLHEAARRGITPEYVGQILAALKDRPAVAPSAPLEEPLSPRELEVLRLITAGLSNREIAEKLVISVGTAKTHVHNLCGKLGVRNRTAAATRAKELNLV